MQRHLPTVVCMLAPYVNCYRRFVPGGAAPINLEWGPDNRTTGIRVPISSPDGRRVENRVVGMDCNPYLALAASLTCGYLGMKAGLVPRDSVSGEAYIGRARCRATCSPRSTCSTTAPKSPRCSATSSARFTRRSSATR